MIADKALLQKLITGGLMAWLVIILGSRAHSYLSIRRRSQLNPTRTIPEWRRLTAGRRPSLGNATAPVVIIEFSDYQCPFCAAVEPRIQNLVSSHPGQAVVYRFNLPLREIHPFAEAASIAANCAQMQGITEPFQASLFSNRDDLSNGKLIDIAKRAGVGDIGEFEKCLSGQATMDSVNRDLATSKRLHITNTPTFIINGELTSGALSTEDLHKAYSRALESAASKRATDQCCSSDGS